MRVGGERSLDAVLLQTRVSSLGATDPIPKCSLSPQIQFVWSTLLSLSLVLSRSPHATEKFTIPLALLPLALEILILQSSHFPKEELQ